MDNAHIRSVVSVRRRQLDHEYRQKATCRITEFLVNLPRVANAQTIAAYIAIGGEVSIDNLINIFLQQGINIVLPCIDIPYAGAMTFTPYNADSDLEMAGFGLSQPLVTRHIDPETIDLVLVPLLAFTDTCHRIGWGKGYYDRCFAFRRTRSAPPCLVGIAFACQQENDIQPQSWDVQLDMVVTEDGILEKS